MFIPLDLGIWLTSGIVLVVGAVFLRGLPYFAGSGLSASRWGLNAGTLLPLSKQQGLVMFVQSIQFIGYPNIKKGVFPNSHSGLMNINLFDSPVAVSLCLPALRQPVLLQGSNQEIEIERPS